MVSSATFNNISIIVTVSVIRGGNRIIQRQHHWPTASHLQPLSHKVVSGAHRHERNSNFSGDSTGSYKSNYHTINIITIGIEHQLWQLFKASEWSGKPKADSCAFCTNMCYMHAMQIQYRYFLNSIT
jgi:hypothetical protein